MYIKREDAVKALRLEYPTMPLFKAMREEWALRTEGFRRAEEVIMRLPSAERKGEWIDCKEPPSTDRNVFIAYGTDDMKSVCIGHYEHDMKLWYEDKNFFAKTIYDAMYWCEIPQFPAKMKGAEDEDN